MIEFDLSELQRLEVAFTKAGRRAEAGLLPVLTKAALNIKQGMAAQAEDHPHFVDLPDAVTYDIAPTGLRSVAARIGPDKRRRQGALGNVFWYGTATLPAQADIMAPLTAEVPNFQDALAALVDL